MTLNASGPLSMGGSTAGQSINLELGVSATALASINSTSFRTLAGVASGQISISNFYGKSNTPGGYSLGNNSTSTGFAIASAYIDGSNNLYVAFFTYAAGGFGAAKFNSSGVLQYAKNWSYPTNSIRTQPYYTEMALQTKIFSDGTTYLSGWGENVAGQALTNLYFAKINSSGTQLIAQANSKYKSSTTDRDYFGGMDVNSAQTKWVIQGYIYYYNSYCCCGIIYVDDAAYPAMWVMNSTTGTSGYFYSYNSQTSNQGTYSTPAIGSSGNVVFSQQIPSIIAPNRFYIFNVLSDDYTSSNYGNFCDVSGTLSSVNISSAYTNVRIDNGYISVTTRCTYGGVYTVCLFSVSLSANFPIVNWVRVLYLSGDSATGSHMPYTDSSGNVYIIKPSYNSSINRQIGVIAKYNSSGVLQWQRSLSFTASTVTGYTGAGNLYLKNISLSGNGSGTLTVTGFIQHNGANSDTSQGFVLFFPTDGSKTGTISLPSQYQSGATYTLTYAAYTATNVTCTFSNNTYSPGYFNGATPNGSASFGSVTNYTPAPTGATVSF